MGQWEEQRACSSSPITSYRLLTRSFFLSPQSLWGREGNTVVVFVEPF